MGSVFAAIAGGAGDLVSKDLRWQAVLGFVLALGLLVAATWATLTYLVPLIPADQPGVLGWFFNAARFVAGAGAIVVALVLLPPITLFVGALTFRQARRRIEVQRLNVTPTAGGGVLSSLGAGVRVSVPSFIVNLSFLPAALIPVLNIALFLTVNAFLSGRAYFDLAAGKDAGVLKRRHGGKVFLAGLPIAALMLIPAAQFLAPTYGAAVMTRLRHRLAPTQDGAPQTE